MFIIPGDDDGILLQRPLTILDKGGRVVVKTCSQWPKNKKGSQKGKMIFFLCEVEGGRDIMLRDWPAGNEGDN